MKRKIYNHSRFKTQYIQLNTKKCKACWKCIDNCSQNVIGKIDFFRHRHVKIINQADCTGCLKCIGVCEFNVITLVSGNKEAC